MRRCCFLALVLASALSGCGKEVPHGGVRSADAANAPKFKKRLDPIDVIPDDLDLVVRLDVARMREQLGAAATEELEAHAVADPGEALLLGAIQKANVVWLALRAGELDAGDRVVVAEGRFAGFNPDPGEWRRGPSANGAVAVFDRREAQRGRTARIVALDERALAFVTPVELDAVARVLSNGADAKRGDPSAEGIVSLDLRAHRLPFALERKFPSIGALIAGLDRVRATAVLVEGGLEIDAAVVGRGQADAERAREFLATLRDNLTDERFAGLKAAKLDLLGSTVRLRAVVPAKLVLGLVDER